MQRTIEEVRGTGDGEALSEFVLSVRPGTFFLKRNLGCMARMRTAKNLKEDNRADLEHFLPVALFQQASG